MSKILIVEDDPLMARLYQKIFTFEGYEVELATNGEEALEKTKTIKPNLLLLDIMMPRMNGLQVLEQLKAHPDTRSIPVVMLTNLAGNHDMESALSKGAIKYLIKSEFEPKQVVSMVKEILSATQKSDTPPST